jgi:hypothetical protein
MTTWQDIEDVMAYWYREGSFGVWTDWVKLEVDVETLAANAHLFTTGSAIHIGII